MINYKLADLIDLAIIQKMADTIYRAIGMPIGIINVSDGSILVGAGWQDICVKYHRANPISLQRCRESDNYINDHLAKGEACHYKCKNGLWDIGIPIIIAGHHLATMFLGQFFYKGETPDRSYFTCQAHELGFDVNGYLAALDRVPVFSREQVDLILEYDKVLVSFITDLAEHALFKINADKRIQESERKFHAVFNQADQFIGLLTLDGRMMEVNKTAFSFGEVKATDIIGRLFWKTPWWAHSTNLQEKIRLAVQSATQGELERLEASYLGNDASIRYIDLSLKPVKDDAGKVIMLLAEARDITQHKQAEAEIKQQAEFLQNLIDAMPYPVFYKDRQGRYLGCNNAFEQYYGISREQMAGKTVYELAPKQLADVYFKADEDLFTHPGMQTYETSVQSTDGVQHDVIFHKATFADPDGAIAGLIGAIVDITERKQAEKERLANLRFFKSMDQVNRAMHGANDLHQMMSDVLEQMLLIFDCDRAWLCYPCDPEAPWWSVPIERTRPEYPGASELGRPIPMDPDVVQVLKTMRAASGPVTFGPGSDQPLVGNVPDRFQEKSQIAVTVYPKVDKPWLIGMHQCSYPRVWTEEEKILFQEIGRRMGDTLNSLLMYRDLRKSEAENRAIVNAVPDLLFRVQKDGIITYFRSPENIEHYSTADHFLNRSIKEILPSDASGAAMTAIANALTTKKVYAFEYNMLVKEQRRYFEGRMAALVNDEVLAVIRDITELKQTEHALQESEVKTRSILDNIGIGVALISPQMEILEMNKRMHEWFPGIDPEQHPICYQAYNNPPSEQRCDYCPTYKTLQDGLVHEATTQTPQADGIHNYRVVSSPIINPSGQVTAAIELVEDITEKLSLESQLRQAQRMESIGRLAGGVAHDFNNMLGVIIGHTELALSRMDQTQPFFSSMKQIRKAALRSANLTQQLLAFARKQTVAPMALDLNETVEGTLKMLRRLIGEDIDLVWLPGSNLWSVKMDPSQIDQILTNLCINARDAIADVGRLTIETHCATFDAVYCASHSGVIPGDFVMLAVSDNGQGMDKSSLEKIFEPFFTTKGIGQGTGLGLATVYGIVKQNNGFINVYSELEQGTVFKIYLPRYDAENGQMHKQKQDVPEPQGHETILVVEDEDAILETTQLILEGLGYQVLTASTPDEAISLARQYGCKIDLVITDVIMPNMSGRDLMRELIAICPGLRSLFMSGYTDNIIARHGVLDQGINFIQKPFSKQALAVAVRNVLDSGYAQQ